MDDAMGRVMARSATHRVIDIRARGRGAVMGLFAVAMLAILQWAGGASASLGAVVGVAVVYALGLKPPDAVVVRFMDFGGYGPWRTLWWHGGSVLGFWVSLALGAIAVAGVGGGVVLGVILLGWVLFLMLRLALYRLMRRRMAEALRAMVLLAGALTMAVFTGMPLPDLLGVLMGALAALDLWLMRRARRVEGMLA